MRPNVDTALLERIAIEVQSCNRAHRSYVALIQPDGIRVAIRWAPFDVDWLVPWDRLRREGLGAVEAALDYVTAYAREKHRRRAEKLGGHDGE